MSIEEITVNTVTLSNDRNEIEEQLENIKMQMDEMASSVTALNQMWSGNANSVFNKAFNDDMKFLISVCDNIQKVLDYEATAIAEYNNCEQKISQMIEEISI